MMVAPETTAAVRAVIHALGLPDSCRVDQRVPKKLLLENGAPTAADKRLITNAIEEIQWVAALKPNTVGVSEYRDAQREYLEVALLTVTLRGTVEPARVARLTELVHRAVPYPVLLLLTDERALTLSLAHKRWAQNETGKVVLDDSPVSASVFCDTTTESVERAFLQSVSVTRQPQSTLHGLYQGWMDCVRALLAAQMTGSYRTSATAEEAAMRRQALADCERLETEISRLRMQAAKEKQLARQVELNLALKCVQAELADARLKL